MRSVLVFAIVVVFWSQHARSKEVTLNKNTVKLDNNLRDLSDIWNNVKNSAENAWKSIKDISQKTKDKINLWIDNVKFRANDVSKEFKIRIEDMKERCHTIIEEIVGKGKLVKQCIKDNNDGIEEIIKHIIQHVTSCISDNILKLSMLGEHQYRLQFNDTDFVDEVEKKLHLCADDMDNTEECVYAVRKEMFDDMNNIEENILRTRSESKNVADDLLDAIISCSVDGLIDASASITIEALQIINCVSNG